MILILEILWQANQCENRQPLKSHEGKAEKERGGGDKEGERPIEIDKC